MHTRIDALTHPYPRSLLPSSVFIGVIITVSVRYASTPLNTLTHPVSVTSITLRTGFTGLSSFRLVPMCTIYRVVVYISGSVLLLGQHIIFPCHTHHNFWRPWLGPNWLRMARTVESIPPWLKPSLQVCWQTRGSELHALVSGELAGWIEKTHSWQDAGTQISHSPNCARILGVLYIVLSLCALSRMKLKPSTSEDVHLLYKKLYFLFPEAWSTLLPGFEWAT